ncbi:MAG: nucleoside hydrolase [Cyclobacteriaceae bacterium]|nr:nucleoside hydrolase [Cyclobacteriaceae bacterium]
MHKILLFLSVGFLLSFCGRNKDHDNVQKEDGRISVIIDTDANNELDDQHALAYLFLNRDIFDVVGVTVNATRGGGPVEEHYKEAERIMKFCKVSDDFPLKMGANGNFEEIAQNIEAESYDGKDAVQFIIEESRKPRNGKLVLLPVGKLTNIALALKKAPDIADKVRIVWLGSNYPDPGEYNLENDIPSMEYVLQQNVQFEMVTVRFGKPSGSDAVRVTPEDIQEKLAGKGPRIETAVTGRHGGSFHTFGNYSVELFSHINLHGDPPSRALYDMVAVAILKNPGWGESFELSVPVYSDSGWVDQPSNSRKIVVWENFKSQEILEDFFSTLGK